MTTMAACWCPRVDVWGALFLTTTSFAYPYNILFNFMELHTLVSFNLYI